MLNSIIGLVYKYQGDEDVSSEKYSFKPAEKAVFSLRNLYRAHGYQHYKVSRFEEYDLYMKNKSFLADENILTFTDTDGRLMALKPDITLSIIKNTKDSQAGPKKVYYNENVYRTDGGGFKEIMQTGLECIGDIDLYSVCEVLTLAYKSLALLGGNFLLDLSHMGFVSGLLEETGANEEVCSKLLHAVSEKNTSSIKAICGEFQIDTSLCEKLCKTAMLYGPADEVLIKMKELIVGDRMRAAFEELYSVCEVLKCSAAYENLRLDFSVINDMNYYNGIIFQGFIETVAQSVLSGGRYDNLVLKMGKKKGAIGFAVYLDGLERTAAEKDFDVDVLLVYKADTPIYAIAEKIEELTREGLTVKAQSGELTDLKYARLLRLDSKGATV